METRSAEVSRGARHTTDGSGFAALWASSTLSNLGDGMLLAAVPLLAASVTRNPTAIAAVAAAATAPWLIFGLPAGAVVDRVDRMRLMRRVDSVRALMVGALGLAIAAELDNLVVLGATVFLLGCAETLFDSAAMAIVPGVVEDAALARANGRLFAGQLVANQFIGPAAGALLFAYAAAAPAFADSVTFAGSAALLFWVRPRADVARAEPTGSASRLRDDVSEGLKFVWRHRDIRLLAIGAAVVNLAETAAVTVLVLWITGPVGLGPSGYGFVLSLGASGGVLGSLVADRLVKRLGSRAVIVGAVWVFAAGLAAIGIFEHPAPAVVGLALTNAAAQAWNVVAVTFRQRETPPELLGRVMSAYRVIAYGSFPIGAMLGGVIAAQVSVRATFAVSACMVAVLAVAIQLRIGRLEPS